MKLILFYLFAIISTNLVCSEIVWQKRYGGKLMDAAHDSYMNHDSTIVIVGKTSSPSKSPKNDGSHSDLYIIKLDSDGEIIWENSIGGSKDDQIYSFDRCTDGGYICTGYSASPEPPINSKSTRNLWAIKCDRNGKMVWSKTYGGSSLEIGKSIKCTDDGGCIIAGSTSSTDDNLNENNGDFDYWILKLDRNGSIEWQELYGGKRSDRAGGIILLSDGNYLVAGNTESSDGDIQNPRVSKTQDIWVIKIDQVGKIIWENNYGGSDSEYFQAVMELSDGNILLTTETGSTDGHFHTNKGRKDVGLIKIDSKGNFQWSKSYGGSGMDGGGWIVEDNSGKIYLSAITQSYELKGHSGGFDCMLLQLDQKGEILSQEIYGGNFYDVINDIKIDSNGNLIMSGYSQSNDGSTGTSHGGADFWIIKITN